MSGFKQTDDVRSKIPSQMMSIGNTRHHPSAKHKHNMQIAKAIRQAEKYSKHTTSQPCLVNRARASFNSVQSESIGIFKETVVQVNPWFAAMCHDLQAFPWN
jgi:hypothetical protein